MTPSTKINFAEFKIRALNPRTIHLVLDYQDRTYRLMIGPDESSTDCLERDGIWHRVRTIKRAHGTN